MNQFRDLLIAALIGLALGVAFTDPNSWTWAQRGGPYVTDSLRFMADAKPWSVVILFALALALFMTRIKY